jgi:hypothetical protein
VDFVYLPHEARVHEAVAPVSDERVDKVDDDELQDDRDILEDVDVKDAMNLVDEPKEGAERENEDEDVQATGEAEDEIEEIDACGGGATIEEAFERGAIEAEANGFECKAHGDDRKESCGLEDGATEGEGGATVGVYEDERCESGVVGYEKTKDIDAGDVSRYGKDREREKEGARFPERDVSHPQPFARRDNCPVF